MNSKISLKTIILLTSITIILIFLTYTFINLKIINKTLVQMENKKIETVIKNNLDTVATLYYFQFDDEIDKILENIKKHTPSIKEIFITKNMPTKDSTTKIYPLKYKNKNLGYLVVKHNFVFRKDFFKSYNKMIFIFIGILLFFLIYSLYYTYDKINSLEKLATKLNKINIFKMKNLELIDNYKEIEIITWAINHLLSAIRETLKKLFISEKHLKEAQKIAGLSSWEYNLIKKEFYCSDQLYRIFYINRKNRLSWERFLNLLDPTDREIFLNEIEYLLKSGKRTEIISKFITNSGVKYLKSIIKIKKGKDIKKIIGISLDITEEINAKRQIEYLAYHDMLTSLPNRNTFNEQLKIIQKLSKREDKKFALVYIDIDNFKFINDTYGHNIGDELLKEVANIISNTLRESDLIFRIGGDEFVAILTNIEDKKGMETVVNKLLKNITKIYNIHNNSFEITCSIGIAIYPDDNENINELIKFADLAMYEAKKEGKNRYKFFDFSMKEVLHKFHIISKDLKIALKKDDELILFLQPKINILDGSISGAEVLIRWQHPKKGMIFPNEFIPVAEKSDIILEIDRYILKKSFQLIKEWGEDELLKNIELSINISAKEFKNTTFIDSLKKLKDKFNIDTSKIELEITETVSMEDINYTTTTLNSLKALGFKVAIDDFGTGYSSLNYLKKIPFDTLKIDKSFIMDIDKDKDDLEITNLIIKIAKTFNKKVIAEGVENKKQETILKDFNCYYAQGYLYSKPVDVKTFVELIKNRNFLHNSHSD